MATQCVTKTSNMPVAAAATVTMADPAAAVITPRPPTDGTSTTEEDKKFTRKFQVDLSKLANEPIAKRVLALVFPPEEESADLEEEEAIAPLWPCLFFKDHDAMLDDLSALHAEMVESDETVDKDDFFDEGALNLLSLKYFEDNEEKNFTTPVLVLMGDNKVILDPSSANLMHFHHGHRELRYHATNSPFLDCQLRKACKIVTRYAGKGGKKRRLEPKRLESTRPLKKACVALKTSGVAQDKASMPVPAAAATKIPATVGVTAAEEPSPGNSVTFSEAPKKPAAKEPTPMDIEAEAVAASKEELDKRPYDERLPERTDQEESAQAPAPKKISLPLDVVFAAQKGPKMTEVAADEQVKSPVQKSLAVDLNQEKLHETEELSAENPATVTSKPAAKPMVRNTVDKAHAHAVSRLSTAHVQAPQPEAAEKTDTVEKPAPWEQQARVVEMEEIDLDATSNKAGEQKETPEAALHSTCSELPQPGSGEMDDDRVLGLKQAVAKVEDSKETIAGGRSKHVQTATKPPRVPERGRTVGRPSTQKKRKGSSIKRRSPSPARAPRLLTAEERKIPTFQQVKPLLEKAGFSFMAERSATPVFRYLSYNENVPASNSEGNDYTHSEEEFRRRLCSQGLGALARDALSEEEAAKVERWVRLAVVTSLPRSEKNLQEEIPGGLPWNTMQCLGYDYHSSQLSGAYNPKVSNQKELILYLTHEGLPNECSFDNVDEKDRLDLELYLAFYERNLFESSFQSRRGRRPSNSLAHSTAKKPRKKQAPTKTAAASSVPPEAPKPNSEFVSPEHCDKAALADCNKSPPSEASPMAGVERDIYAEMDKNDNNMERLENCLANLERSAIATDGKGIVLGPSGSHFRKNITKTTGLLESMIKSRMDHKRHSLMKEQPAALFVCGSPGIGKTTAVSSCCQTALVGFTDPDGIWVHSGVQPVTVEVNCTQFAAGGNIRSVVQQKLWEACNGDNGTTYNEASMKKMLTSTSQSDAKKRLVILVLDEIDQLVNPNVDSDVSAKTSGEKLIQLLGKWCAWSDKNTLRFVLIGIGNTMNGPKYRRVKHLMNPKEIITFQAYESTDLENIMRARMEDASVVDPKALSFIAKKAASSSKGDARPAIELLATALKDAKERVKNQAGKGHGSDGALGGQYIVKISDVVKLNTDFTRLSQLIKDLSLYAKMVVCAAVNLAMQSNASGSEFIVTRTDLLDATRRSFYEKLGENSFDEAEASALISTLDDNGIAKIGMDDTIVFSHMPQELETAVNDSLGKDDFFGL